MSDRVISRRAFGLAIASSAILPAVSLSADDALPPDPAKAWNLEKVGQTWITSREAEIRRRLAAQPELESRITAIELSLRTTIQENSNRWKQRNELERGLDQLRKGLTGLGTTEKSAREDEIRRLQQQIEPLRSAAWAPEKLGGVPEVRGQLVDLTQTRTAALVSAAVARELAPQLSADYARLAKNPRVAEWQKATKAKLGPLKNYDNDLRKLARLEELVLSSPLWDGGTPLWIEADRWRLGGIANEHLPVTFTWDESAPSAIVTTNWQQAAGLEVEPGREREALKVAGRTFTVRHHRLAYLRLGRHVIRDVDVLVLPPEGEDIGCRLGPGALHGQHALLEPQHLRLRVRASDSGK